MEVLGDLLRHSHVVDVDLTLDASPFPDVGSCIGVEVHQLQEDIFVHGHDTKGDVVVDVGLFLSVLCHMVLEPAWCLEVDVGLDVLDQLVLTKQEAFWQGKEFDVVDCAEFNPASRDQHVVFEVVSIFNYRLTWMESKALHGHNQFIPESFLAEVKEMA